MWTWTLTEEQARAQGYVAIGHTVYAADGRPVGDFDADSRLARIDGPLCSPRLAGPERRDPALGGLLPGGPLLPPSPLLVDVWARN